MDKATRRQFYYAMNRERQIASARAWQLAHPERARESQRRRYETQREYHTARSMVRGARERAALKGIPFDEDFLTTAYVEARLRHNLGCDCCGAAFDVGLKGKIGPQLRSPTLDRLRGFLGYVEGNVTLICWRCNRLKSDATPEELERIAAWIRRTGG